MKGKPKVTPKEFIEIWLASESISEVAEKVGTSASAVSTRAKRFRDNGVPLPELAGSRGHDWDSLVQYAASLQAKNKKK